MKTKNKKLLDKKANREYYKKSDGQFMTLEQALFAHRHLDRVAWARKWVHEMASRSHIDIGCKDGYFCLTLASEGIECVGIDPSEDAIEEAKLKASETKLDNMCKFMVGYAEDIPDKVGADSVSCLEVLEHVVNPERLMNVLCRIGNIVLISTPDAKGKHGLKDSERNEEHLRLYSEKELMEFIKPYGKILECSVRDGQICICLKPE